MGPSRRVFLKSAASATLATAAALPALADSSSSRSPDDIVDLFERLPGHKAFKIFAPAVRGDQGFLAELNAGQMLFVASAIKTFVLCQALRRVDSPNLVEKLEATPLALDATVWSPGAPTFNPPHLRGIVSERTTLEAMITRSDNTATDMMFKHVGPEKVRQFIASVGLKKTLVPNSTRAFSAYLFGAPNYLTITWDELEDLLRDGTLVNPFLNRIQTLASAANDFVSYYSRALRGKFFAHKETLNEFRRILTLCDFIYLVPLPLGVSAYAKSGNADFPDFHVRAIAGGLWVGHRWIFFAFIINWYARSPSDPETVDQFFSAIHRSLTWVKDSLVG